MTKPEDIVGCGAALLARLVRERRVSAVEVVEAFIARNEEVHASLNALVVPRFDEARVAAREADRALARGDEVGPLHGVPVTIKEQYRVAGTAATIGLPSRKGLVDEEEGPLVTRLRKAGAIVLGKTNLSQLRIFLESDNPVYGRTQNPWNAERSCGGSSGGEAAIVAARGSPLGLGGDLGGSTRVPAHFCGVHAFKPTSGRLPDLDTPAMLTPPQEGIVAQPGPIARYVDDLVLAMEVLAAPERGPRDPMAPPIPWSAPPPSVERLRVGYFESDDNFTPSPSIRRVVREAARALEAAGAVVQEWKPPSAARAMQLFTGLIASDRLAGARRWSRTDPVDRRVKGLFMLASMPVGLLPVVASLAGVAGQKRLSGTLRALEEPSAEKYFDLLVERNEFRQAALRSMDDLGVDVIVCPPCALPAFTHGASEFLFDSASSSVMFNVLGFPAGVVAAGRVRAGEESDRKGSRDRADRTALAVEKGSAGLPIGVQVAARPWREDIVLAAMRTLEAHFAATDDYPDLARSQEPIRRAYASASTSGASERRNSTDTARR